MEKVFYNIPDECRKNDAACRNTSYVVKLKYIYCGIYLFFSHGITLPPMRHKSYVVRQDKFVAQQKLSSYLVFQLVAQHHLNACDISTLACDKVRLIQVL